MVWGCVLAGGVELRKRIRRECLYGFMDTSLTRGEIMEF
jgi:hypothetical protein